MPIRNLSNSVEKNSDNKGNFLQFVSIYKWYIIPFVFLFICCVYLLYNLFVIKESFNILQENNNFLVATRNNSYNIMYITYQGALGKNNNLIRSGDNELILPDAIAEKQCFMLGDIIRGTMGGALGGRIGSVWKEDRFIYVPQYEASFLYDESQKLKLYVSKNTGTENEKLTIAERNNFSLSIPLLCF